MHKHGNTEKNNVKKLQCKQNNMQTQKHEENIKRNYNVNTIICKHRNTKKHFKKLQ